ncbi:hypothetical protein, partial [uncultured Desulfovibrio sp.]|uniref:hypothetical protein n=1 Tax=uncultured Desulfovibrio sp. TaxID=167968 RepID=UPI00260CA1DA
DFLKLHVHPPVGKLQGGAYAGHRPTASGGILTIRPIANIESSGIRREKGARRKYFEAPDSQESGASS